MPWCRRSSRCPRCSTDACLVSDRIPKLPIWALGALSSIWGSGEDPQSRPGGGSLMDAGNQIPLREPPEGFLTPRDVDRVVAILDDPAQVSEAIKDLAREGFDQEEIVVLSGPEGAARVEAPNQQRGLRGRLSR